MVSNLTLEANPIQTCVTGVLKYFFTFFTLPHGTLFTPMKVRMGRNTLAYNVFMRVLKIGVAYRLINYW